MSDFVSNIAMSSTANSRVTHKGSKRINSNQYLLNSDLFYGDYMLIRIASGADPVGDTITIDNAYEFHANYIKEGQFGAKGRAAEDNKFAGKVQIALKIVLGALDNWPYNHALEQPLKFFEHVKKFQDSKDKNGNFKYPELQASDEYKKFGSKTVLALDKRLNEIFFYSYKKEDEARILHDASTSKYVGVYAPVLNNCELFNAPNGAQVVIGTEVETIKKFDSVFLIQILSDKQWFYVETMGGIQGYLKKQDIYLETAMPDLTAKLFKISGASVNDFKTIIQDHVSFQKTLFKTGNTAIDLTLDPMINDTASEQSIQFDRSHWKFYTIVTLYFNNLKGHSRKKNKAFNTDTGLFDIDEEVSAGIYLKTPKEWEPFQNIFFKNGKEKELKKTYQHEAYKFYEGAIEDWDTDSEVQLKKDKYIWLPGIAYVNALYEELQAGDENTGIQIIKNLTQKAKDLFDGFKENLNDLWPIHAGYRLSAAVGATFGIPIGADADYYFAIWRDSDSIIKVVRRGTLEGGLDLGVGAEAQIGFGSKSKNRSRESQYKAIGGSAGLQAKAGIKILVHQEMEFNLKNDMAVVYMLIYALQLENKPSIIVQNFVMLLKYAANIDPKDYTTKFKFEPGAYIRGNAKANLQLGFDENKDKKGNFWLQEDRPQSKNTLKKGDALDPFSLLSHFSFAIGAQTTFEVAASLTIEHENIKYDPLTGFRLAEQTKVEFSFDFEALASLDPNMSIPFFPKLSVLKFEKQLGAGIKVQLKYDTLKKIVQKHDIIEFFKEAKFIPFLKKGDVDCYLAPAQEIELQLAFTETVLKLLLDKDATIDSIKQEILNDPIKAFEKVKFRKIMGIGDIFPASLNRDKRKKINSFFSNKKDLNILINHKDKDLYKCLNVIALVDLTYEPPRTFFENFIKSVYENLKGGGLTLAKFLNEIFYCFQVKKIPQKYKDAIIKAIDEAEIPKLHLHVELGASLGLTASVAELAKLRLRLDGSLNVVWHVTDTQRIFDKLLKEKGIDLRESIKMLFLLTPKKGSEILHKTELVMEKKDHE